MHLHSSTKYCGECSITKLPDLAGLCGCLPFSKVVETARDEFGMEYLAISNHAFDPAVLKPDYQEARGRVLAEAGETERLNRESDLRIKLLSGVETNILPGGQLDVDDQTLSELGVVVAAKHPFPGGQTAKDIKSDFLEVLKNPFVDILGHPNRWIGGLSLDDWDEVFAAAAKNTTAVEINVRTPLSDELLKSALKQGAKFSVGSDAHELTNKESEAETTLAGLYQRMGNLLDHLSRLGIEDRRILNTYSFERLKEWLRGRG